MSDTLCSVDGCDRPVLARGLCGAHYARLRKFGDPGEAQLQRLPAGSRRCSVEDCDRVAVAGGWCHKHSARVRRYGTTELPNADPYEGTDRKTCRACREVKDRSEFYPHKLAKDGVRSECKLCTKRRVVDYNEANAPRLAIQRRDARIVSQYGLPKGTWERLLTSQGGKCAICHGPPNAKGGFGKAGFHLDHDHGTGELRGILCSKCNTDLGRYGDDPVRLQAAIDYLLSPPAKSLKGT